VLWHILSTTFIPSVNHCDQGEKHGQPVKETHNVLVTEIKMQEIIWWIFRLETIHGKQ